MSLYGPDNAPKGLQVYSLYFYSIGHLWPESLKEEKFEAEAIHGELTPAARRKIVESFLNNTTQVNNLYFSFPFFHFPLILDSCCHRCHVQRNRYSIPSLCCEFRSSFRSRGLHSPNWKNRKGWGNWKVHSQMESGFTLVSEHSLLCPRPHKP